MKSIRELMDLGGRAALITGGAGHIGQACAEALAEAGCAVAVLDLDQGRCEETAQDLAQRFQVKTLGLALDLADEKAVQAAPERVARDLGSLDILVHCAAFVGTSKLAGWATPFAEQLLDTWRAALEVNLTAPFAMTQAAAPLLKASGHGAVVNVASTYGVVGPDWSLYDGTAMGNPAAYAASKGGLVQLTRWLATTLAPHIRVNCLSPGGVFRNQPESFVQRYEARTPAQRMATEEDMKGTLLYLASDLSLYVTGQNILVDGGWTAW